MSDWRDRILREFAPQASRLTIVADPDELLLEEKVLEGIRARGFDLITFEDHVAFRFAYESDYRSRWDRGEMTDLVVVLRAPTSELDSLPFDLLQAGRRLSFTLGETFPTLSYRVVAALDRADLDSLHRAVEAKRPGTLGENATKDFVLLHVFAVAPETIQRPADLLRVLLQRHYRSLRIPPLLDERLIQVLRASGAFDGWPLDRIVPDREAFFAFLQERWPAFLDRATNRGEMVREPVAPYGLEFPGPVEIPFEHDDVRVYIDNLFLEGVLRPVEHPEGGRIAGHWASVGLRTEPTADRARRLDGLLEALGGQVPGPEARHRDWLLFAPKWAEVSTIWSEASVEERRSRLEKVGVIQATIDSGFEAWAIARFGGLHNQPPVPPVMLHHVPRALARRRESGGSGRLALLLLDGLAFDQWTVLREVLIAEGAPWRYHEEAVFAWVPTVTPVSRQALFSGREPLYFAESIFRTDRDGPRWAQFWIDHGLGPNQVGHFALSGEPGELTDLADRLDDNHVALGIVVEKVDKIMHGMQLGAAGMLNQVRQWANGGFLRDLLELLAVRGFEIHLTSDHGNIEATGIGRPNERSLADTRGERVRIYSDERLRASVQERFPDAIAWPRFGLPGDCWPLLAKGRTAFVGKGERIVGHGGITIEETIVPLVRFERIGS